MQMSKKLKVIICIVLAVLIAAGATVAVFLLTGNSSGGKKKQIVVVKKKVISTDNNQGDNQIQNGDNTGNGQYTYDEFIDGEVTFNEGEGESVGWENTRRPLAVKEPEDDPTDAENYDFKKEYTSKQVSWDGPAGYVIVYKNGNKHSYVYAKHLQAFIKENEGHELPVVTDSKPAVAKEILIGDTNRYKTSLKENEFEVSLKGKKLVFEGGHRAMLEKAIKWFMSIPRSVGSVAVLEGVAEDFKATLDDGYEYVWGDEFDGDYFDLNKWAIHSHMGGVTNAYKATSGENFRVEDGMYKMNVTHYFNEYSANEYLALPHTVCTSDTMQWLFGYAELKARLPMYKGCWPAWWTTTGCGGAGKAKGYFLDYDEAPYLVEIDIFEVFGTEDGIVPNIHKWYGQGTNEWYSYVFDENGNQIKHMGWTDMGLPRYTYWLPSEQRFDYLIVGYEWTPEFMKISVDGDVFAEYDMSNNFDNMTDMSGFVEIPQHMIFDDWVTYETDGTPKVVMEELPYEFYVDYVRIYQKPNEGYLLDYGIEDKEPIYDSSIG